MTEEKTTGNGGLQGHVRIDFSKKWHSRPAYQKKAGSSLIGGQWGVSNLSSENFWGHKDIVQESMHDPKKFIKPGEKPVRIWSLMGLEQVGQCIFIEYENDMIIVDAGMEFAAEEELGADYIVPDISYIKKNKHKLRGIVLSHGHLDHVGALRDILPELDFPMIYTTPLTLGIVKKTFDDPKLAAKIKYKIVDPFTDLLQLGCFSIEFVLVNHNIPETLAQAIYTPKGVIFNTADFKIDHTPAIDKPADLAKIARIGTEGVKLLIADALGVTNKWVVKSEKLIGDTIDSIIKQTPGRVIVATFASNIGRVIQLINSAVKYNRTVFLSGRSMVNNVEIAQELWYIKPPKGMLRKLDGDVNNMPDERVLILSTGAQGEEFAALTRMSRKDHSDVELKPSDLVMLSSSTIPGNERQMHRMMDNLTMLGVNLIATSDMDVHASGHGGEEDHKLMLALTKPQFFMPYYIEATMRYAYRKVAMDMGIPSDRILMPHENGAIIEMYDDVVMISDEKLKLDTILVDGKGKWHLSGEYVVKARHIMAQNGIVSFIIKVDTQTKQLVGNIQIESRWFVYSSEVKNIHTQIVEFVRSKYNQNAKRNMEVRDNLRIIKDDLGGFINKVIGRTPMIVPMFVYINRDAKDDVAEEDAIVGMTLEEQGVDS